MAGPSNAVEATSKKIFNSKHRLTIVAAFQRNRDSALDVDDVVRETGAPRTPVHNECALLSEIGVLQRLEGNGRVFYQQRPSAFWEWCSSLLEQHADVEDARPG